FGRRGRRARAVPAGDCRREENRGLLAALLRTRRHQQEEEEGVRPPPPTQHAPTSRPSPSRMRRLHSHRCLLVPGLTAMKKYALMAFYRRFTRGCLVLPPTVAGISAAMGLCRPHAAAPGS